MFLNKTGTATTNGEGPSLLSSNPLHWSFQGHTEGQGQGHTEGQGQGHTEGQGQGHTEGQGSLDSERRARQSVEKRTSPNTSVEQEVAFRIVTRRTFFVLEKHFPRQMSFSADYQSGI